MKNFKNLFILISLVTSIFLIAQNKTEFEKFMAKEETEFKKYSAKEDSLFKAYANEEIEIINSYLKLGVIDTKLEEKAKLLEKKIKRESKPINPQKLITKLDSLVSKRAVKGVEKMPTQKVIEPPVIEKKISLPKKISKEVLKLEVDANRPIYYPLSKGSFRVSSAFNKKRLHPVLKYIKPHNGIDLAGERGTPVFATANGEVLISKFNGGAGNYIKINHKNGYYTVFMHLKERKVKVGEKVKAGQIIGYVGTTGRSTGPHLHYEVRKHENAIDPANFMKKYFN